MQSMMYADQQPGARSAGTIRRVIWKGLILALSVFSFAKTAVGAGLQLFTVPASGAAPRITGAVWYPCAESPGQVVIAPFVLRATRDCAVLGTHLPLVVISHGRTGSFLGQRDTAEALADAGFVVAAISHPGDSALDPGRSNDLSVFIERPADMSRLIDYMLGSWSQASTIDPARIGIFGFSRGGYTALVDVGAEPRFGPMSGLCDAGHSQACDELNRGKLAASTHDARIKAAVVMDPLGMFFEADSFRNVVVPIQLWRSERGGDGVTPESVAQIAEALPSKPEFHTVANAGHFAFLSPCSIEISRELPELCSDAQGFDRVQFHRDLNAQAISFFRSHLPPAQH